MLEVAVDPSPLFDRVLDDEGLTAGLDEADAMLLIRALCDRVKQVAARVSDSATGRRKTDVLCRQARTIAKTAAAAAAPAGSTAAELRRLIAEWPTTTE
jgi:hypothetical protein